MNNVAFFCLGLWLGAITAYIVIMLLIDDEERKHKPPHDNE